MKLRIASLIVMALIPAMLMVGCSDNSSVGTQPDTTPPLAPVILGARAADGVIGVWWSAGNEPDLQGYHVYMSRNGVVTRLTDRAVTVNRYSEPVNQNGSATIYVTAVDYSGNESSPSADHVVRFEGDQINGIPAGIDKMQDAQL